MGTRLLPISRVVPKELLPLIDKPIIYYIVEEAYQSGIRHIIFIINPWKHLIREYFVDIHGKSTLSEFPNLKFSFLETNDQFGDGHAIFLAKHLVRQEKFFAVSMGDLLSPQRKPFLKQLIQVNSRENLPVISVERVPRNHVDRYGIVSPITFKGTLHQVGSIVEKPPIGISPSNLAMTGKYILSTEIFAYLEVAMKHRLLGKEVRLADALNAYAAHKKLLALTCKGNHFDTGNKFDLLRTQYFFGRDHSDIGKQFRKFLKLELKKTRSR